MSMIGRQPARAAMTADDIGNNTIDSNKIINSSIVAADIGALDASVMTGVMPVGVTGGSGLDAVGGIPDPHTAITTDVIPSADATKNLGSATMRWNNIYTTDLHLANERGNWTVIEEENYLTLRNNNTNKVYKLVMEEIE